jgi:hypothetical protein
MRGAQYAAVTAGILPVGRQDGSGSLQPCEAINPFVVFRAPGERCCKNLPGSQYASPWCNLSINPPGTLPGKARQKNAPSVWTRFLRARIIGRRSYGLWPPPTQNPRHACSKQSLPANARRLHDPNGSEPSLAKPPLSAGSGTILLLADQIDFYNPTANWMLNARQLPSQNRPRLKSRRQEHQFALSVCPRLCKNRLQLGSRRLAGNSELLRRLLG